MNSEVVRNIIVDKDMYFHDNQVCISLKYNEKTFVNGNNNGGLK